jgi:trans-aconitate methyltransferase
MHYAKVFFFSVFFFAKALADPWNGADYAQNSSVQLSHAERLLQNLSLQGNEAILDLGCGDGKISALLSQKVPQGFVIGIDPSISMLTKAQENCAFNLSFCEGRAEDLS